MVIYLCTTPQHLWRCIEVCQVIFLLLALLGLYQWTHPDKQLLPEFFSFSRKVANMEEIRRGQVRVTATFNGQELFAEFLAMSTILQYVLFRRARGLAIKTFWFLSILALLGALFATATRGGIITLVVGFLYMLTVGGSVIPRFQMMKVITLALALFYLSYELVGPLVSFMVDRLMNIGSADSSIQSRSVVLGQAFRAIADSPFLGHGIAIPENTFTGPVTRNIHNLYVTLAYTIGIPGLVAFIWLCASLFRASWRTFHGPQVPRDLRELALALNVTLVMFLVDEFKIEFTREPMTMHLAWLFLAWHVAVWRVARQPQTSAADFA
jgi:O-antigen ligase